MQYSEDVKRLAETLKSSGIADSLKDALEKAQSMLGKKEIQKEEINEISKEETVKPMNINTPQEKKEEVQERKIDYSKERKVDLSQVFKAK